MARSFCVLGNAMNAKNMRLGEDVSPGNLRIALVSLALLAVFLLT